MATETQNTEKKRPAMEVKKVFFSYGKNEILKGASLEIEKGKVTTIMGANGCGKSTLFSLMTKNLVPGKGKVLLGGKNIAHLRLNEFARKVAIVHQYNTAADDITVERLVSFGRTPHLGMMGIRGDEDERYVNWAMEVTNVSQFRDREFGMTIVMVLHDINQSIYFSDKIIGLAGGKVIVEGEPEEVITEESIHELYGIDLKVARVDGRKFVLTV